MHVLDVLFRLLHGESRLVTFLLSKRQCRLIRSAVGLDVQLKLSQSTLGLFEGKQVLLSVNRAYQFVLADLEFGTAYRVFCFQ